MRDSWLLECFVRGYYYIQVWSDDILSHELFMLRCGRSSSCYTDCQSLFKAAATRVQQHPGWEEFRRLYTRSQAYRKRQESSNQATQDCLARRSFLLTDHLGSERGRPAVSTLLLFLLFYGPTKEAQTVDGRTDGLETSDMTYYGQFLSYVQGCAVFAMFQAAFEMSTLIGKCL